MALILIYQDPAAATVSPGHTTVGVSLAGIPFVKSPSSVVEYLVKSDADGAVTLGDTVIDGTLLLAGDFVTTAATGNAAGLTSGTLDSNRLPTNTKAYEQAANSAARLALIGGAPLASPVFTGTAAFTGTITLPAYTVATLPTGMSGAVVGMTAYANDLLAPTYGAVAVGGGAVARPVFYDGVNWVT